MDAVNKANTLKLKELGDFWFKQYGTATVGLLMDNYEGYSLARIDPQTGKPKV